MRPCNLLASKKEKMELNQQGEGEGDGEGEEINTITIPGKRVGSVKERNLYCYYQCYT